MFFVFTGEWRECQEREEVTTAIEGKDAVISAKFLCVVQSNLSLFCCFFFKELQVMVEDEQKARDEARESQAKAERNANKLNAEMEELRAQLEQVSS